MTGFELLQQAFERFAGSSEGSDDGGGSWRTQETRQVYRIVEETLHDVKVEAYEVDILIHTETDVVDTEVQQYLWGDWFRKGDVSEWPNPIAQAYMKTKMDPRVIPVDDFWVLE